MDAAAEHLEEANVLKESVKEEPRPRLVWQIGDKEPRLAEVLAQRYAGTVTRIFNEDTGYDFRRAGDRKKFTERGPGSRDLLAAPLPGLGDASPEGPRRPIDELHGEVH